jgi:ABC-type multidrug transport system fused ATPase/permease subunit
MANMWAFGSTDEVRISDVGGTLRRLGSYMAVHKVVLGGAGLSILVVSALSMIPPWLAKHVIDDVISRPVGARSVLFQIAAALLIIHVARALLTYANRYAIAWAGQKVVLAIGRDMFGRLERMPLKYFEKQESGVTMSRLVNDVNAIQQALIGPTVNAAVGIVDMCIYLVILTTLNWRLTLMIAATVPALIVTTRIISDVLRVRYRKVQESTAKVNAVLQENVAGVRVARAFARESTDRQRFDTQSRQNMGANMDAVKVQAVAMPTMQMIGAAGTSLVLWYGAAQVMMHQMTVGELVAFMTYLVAFYMPINFFSEVNNVASQALAAADRIFGFLDEPIEQEKPGAIDLPPIRGQVRFEGVQFAYEAGRPVLQDVELDVRAGEMVALVGHTGSGKTTLANLVGRFYDPTAGRVTVDGHDLKDVTLYSLRSQMAIVLQETFLFGTTVRANIAYGKLEATDEEIESAARLANAHDFIVKLPGGYAFEVAEGGTRLSRGQRQRIALARAILRDPRILILDEATSDVDTETELQIQAALDRVVQGRTVFVIAHRLSTVRNAHKIVVLDHGRIVEVGHHDELVARNGQYRQLVEMQFAPPSANGAAHRVPAPVA